MIGSAEATVGAIGTFRSFIYHGLTPVGPLFHFTEMMKR